MTATEKDILAASSIIEGKKINKQEPYRKIYSTQTEDSRELFKVLSSHWENSLFIGGSADQLLNAILYGSRNITVVDANPLAIHYILLKLAAINILENEEFLSFASWCPSEDTNLCDLLNQVEPLLDKSHPYFDRDPIQFWRALFANYSKDEIARNLFYEGSTEDERHYQKEEMVSKNPYLEKRFYRYLKKVLLKTDIQVVNRDIQEIDTVTNLPPLDKIYLSNILLEMHLSLEEYQNFLDKKIYPLLSSQGEAMIAYLNISHT
ncbi:MAG: BtaA family protein, partial [Bacilli bacterium]|nr:BtaA family protein [Bacilli bacterium]